MQVCFQCQQELPAAQFRLDRTQEDGLRPKCKACAPVKPPQDRKRRETDAAAPVTHKVHAPTSSPAYPPWISMKFVTFGLSLHVCSSLQPVSSAPVTWLACTSPLYCLSRLPPESTCNAGLGELGTRQADAAADDIASSYLSVGEGATN